VLLGVAVYSARPVDAADPFKAAAGKPEKKEEPAAEADAALDVRIPVDGNSHVTFGPAGCPVIVCGNHVWNIRDGAIQVELDGKVEHNALTALSDDGKYFAAAMKSKNQEETPVCVWSTESGQKVCEIPGTPNRYADMIVFSRNKYLILGGRSSSDFRVWDIEEAKEGKPIDVKAKRIEQGKAAFSADGELFLAVVNDKLTLFRTATGKPVTVMSPPRRMVRGAAPVASAPAAVAPKPVRGKPAPIPAGDPFDAVFVYAWMQALKFSPDGTEIAAVSTHPNPRLIVWDTKGKLLFDEPLMLPSMAFWEHSLQWLPDKSGWLVSGHIVDRESKRPVVGIRKVFGNDLRVWLYDTNHLIGSFPSNPAELQSYAIPWKEIRESIASMNDVNAALLAPSKSVSINIEFGGQLSGDANQTAAQIANALGERLKRDGIKVANGQKTTFHLRFSEQAGDTLPIYSRQSPFDFRGSDTGRTATERKGSLVVELTAEGQDAPLWRESLGASSARSFREDINDTSIRKTMIESLTRQIGELYLPYFIPKDESRLALPVVFQ
jgi:WD40 repeat protein